jgi:plasmid stabilization system protein ParE
MKYRVELAASAKADIREAARWLTEQASPAVATRWLAGLDKAMSTLETQPERCPVAAESHSFPVEIRELLYGRSKKGKHRIVFTIANDVVHILYVRHTARDELEL